MPYIVDHFNKSKIIIKFIAASMALLLLVSCDDTVTEAPEAVIGNEGVVLARTIATRFPYRKGGSEQESEVADLIVSELKKAGLDPVIDTFQLEEGTSQNIVVEIPGKGFVDETTLSTDEEPEIFHRQVIIGAHYDTVFSESDFEEDKGYDGINGNASGTGALLSIAGEIKTGEYGYDIVIVFFGAGSLDFAGAEHFASSMTQKEIADTDAMYCIDSIYAGDKLYAHSGMNSLEEGMKYIRRRKLYELSDVALSSSIDLRFNESDLDIQIDEDEEPEVYREISLNESDHLPFDKLGISCVFIESFEYFASSFDGQKESKNPYFGDTNGKIRGTAYDSTKYLAEVLEEDRLETRIKNVAYLIVKALEKGIYK